MEKFDTLIIGGGAAGLSCALILGSAQPKPFAIDKKVGIFSHQRTSHLQDALLNNVLGLAPKTKGLDVLDQGKTQLNELYPDLIQIDKEKVLKISRQNEGYEVFTNNTSYFSKIVVIAVGYTKNFFIQGLEEFIAPHPKTKAEKERIYLLNKDHLVQDGLYVAGTLAGWRSQYAIACGSGAAVATDILTLWNGGEHTKIHDKVKSK